MDKPRKEQEKISFRVTREQKNQLYRRAALEQKSISKIFMDAASSASDKSKIDLFKPITSELTELKKQLYVVSRLLLLIGTSEKLDADTIIDFFRTTEAKAEKIFGEGD